MAGRMAQSLLPADDPFIRHALQFRGILVQLIKQKHFLFPDKQQKGVPHADPPQPIRPYPGCYQRRPHLVILPSFLPGGPYLFICGGHCSFHSLSGQTGFLLKAREQPSTAARLANSPPVYPPMPSASTSTNASSPARMEKESCWLLRAPRIWSPCNPETRKGSWEKV